MKDRIALVCHGPLIRVMISSLVLVLGCSAGGCGANPGPDTESPKMPVGAKSLQEHMKKQAAMKKGAMGQRQPGGPSGR
jgi:hypothetical protein